MTRQQGFEELVCEHMLAYDPIIESMDNAADNIAKRHDMLDARLIPLAHASAADMEAGGGE